MGVEKLVIVLLAFVVGDLLEAYFKQRERPDYASMAKLACRAFFWFYLATMGYELVKEAAATIRLFP